MEDYIETVKTNEQEDAGNTDGNPQSEESSAVFEDSTLKPWKNSENAKNAKRRREEERQKELLEVRNKTILETLEGKNPYTNEPMKDENDIQEFLTMRQIEKSGGDPLLDYRKKIKENDRERQAKIAEEESKKTFYENDRKAFVEKYPNVKLAELAQDDGFVAYSSGKIGEMPLSEIYEGFVELKKTFEKQARQTAERMIANSKATPGALSNNNNPEGFFTREQVKYMTREEVKANFEKIEESMKHWKD